MRQQLVEPTGWLQRQAIAAVVRAGFGCTSMAPEARQLPDDLHSYIRCLKDWSWSADGQAPPSWYANAA